MALSIASTPFSSILPRGLSANSSSWGIVKPLMLLGRRRSGLNATKGLSSVCEPLPPLWFPGSSVPEWLGLGLDGSFFFSFFLFPSSFLQHKRERSRISRVIVSLGCYSHSNSSIASFSRRSIKSSVRVTNDSSRAEFSPDVTNEKSDADKIVDGLDFGELCDEFECISSPLVEATARQLVRDILELREGNRALGTYATSVKYKDPVRSFTGREKYKRSLWATDALEKPTASVQEMMMLSTSQLSIKWTLKGKPKSFLTSIGGDLIVKIHSKFTLNQISGQVIEHEEIWDLSASPILAQAYFWASRRLFAAAEAGKDAVDFVKGLPSRFTPTNKNVDVYPDPSGDPTKFFQRDDSFQRDAYQFALFLALLYFLVQFLRETL